ncbi:DNA (cytosine-5)-methyltransferase CMT2-like [Chlorella sorokiniana]|uniref:DNA (Cytosine-5)-methyltransferase CMT2-like n=1 Tax=Chlorella sorokiniana TaxID=3076 RepID=A0A2P6U3Z4_CHLSO|nr:DNA (cytosine-5)-methyltransferase CMT2-like [Chlorella sorokiniana]|eukprot:PRW61032.1 DNA (cytosine-5)-methyltransferase CMT2-like [Chlorella sorokiniana]
MALRRLLAGVAQGALRATQQQMQALPCALAAAGSLTVPRAQPAAAAARLFGSSSVLSSSSSSLGLASLQQLVQRGGGMAAATSGRLACSGGAAVAAAAGAAGRAAGAAGWLRQQLRWRNDSSHLVPKFKGGKMKSYSSYKSRFKVTGSGLVVYKRAGYVHKRFNKSKSALGRLGGPLAVMKPKYAKTVRKLGFKTRRLS